MNIGVKENQDIIELLQENILMLENENIILQKKLEYATQQIQYMKSMKYTNHTPSLSIYSIDFLYNAPKNTEYVDVVVIVKKGQLRCPIIQIPYTILSKMLLQKTFLIESYIHTEKYALLRKIEEKWVWCYEKN